MCLLPHKSTLILPFVWDIFLCALCLELENICIFTFDLLLPLPCVNCQSKGANNKVYGRQASSRSGHSCSGRTWTWTWSWSWRSTSRSTGSSQRWQGHIILAKWMVIAALKQVIEVQLKQIANFRSARSGSAISDRISIALGLPLFEKQVITVLLITRPN